jgi:hypothetical protein
MKPLRLRAGVEWEQGLLGSALWEGIPLARGASRPLKGGERPNLINKELVIGGRLVRQPPAFLFPQRTSLYAIPRAPLRESTCLLPLARNSLNSRDAAHAQEPRRREQGVEGDDRRQQYVLRSAHLTSPVTRAAAAFCRRPPRKFFNRPR